MTYNDATKRFEYVKSGLTDGKTHYRYKANGAYVVDAFNSNSENIITKITHILNTIN